MKNIHGIYKKDMRKSRLLRKSRKNKRSTYRFKKGGGFMDSFTNFFKSSTVPSNTTNDPQINTQNQQINTQNSQNNQQNNPTINPTINPLGGKRRRRQRSNKNM
jgi:hypothetical protein